VTIYSILSDCKRQSWFPTETIKPKTQSLIGSIVLDIAPSASCGCYTYVAIVPVGIDGVSSGLPLGPYCPMKDPSSIDWRVKDYQLKECNRRSWLTIDIFNNSPSLINSKPITCITIAIFCHGIGIRFRMFTILMRRRRQGRASTSRFGVQWLRVFMESTFFGIVPTSSGQFSLVYRILSASISFNYAYDYQH
ncbi:hypothetical protein ALC57_00569, partial [Trachymyrmex cornetzi]